MKISYFKPKTPQSNKTVYAKSNTSNTVKVLRSDGYVRSVRSFHPENVVPVRNGALNKNDKNLLRASLNVPILK